MNTEASVAPEVLRIWASSQSQTQLDPVHSPSVVVGQYQKLSLEAPDGTTTAWLSELSPAGSGPERRPSRADPVPVWALAVEGVGGRTPLVVQDVKPPSKPPFCTTDAVADGVTLLDWADGGPVPLPFEAVTVNV